MQNSKTALCDANEFKLAFDWLAVMENQLKMKRDANIGNAFISGFVKNKMYNVKLNENQSFFCACVLCVFIYVSFFFVTLFFYKF